MTSPRACWACVNVAGRKAVELERTAFYPTSGGQRHDTGWLELTGADGQTLPNIPKVRVEDVIEDEAANVILHVVDALPVLPGEPFARGFVDVERRQDHMQQHSGQHVLSAVLRQALQCADRQLPHGRRELHHRSRRRRAIARAT